MSLGVESRLIRNLLLLKGLLFAEMKQEAEESGSTSATAENVVEKGEVEATKEGEKEKDHKNSDKNEKETNADKEKDATNEQEVVFIQDMGFTVKIISPGSEPFDIQVSSMELVQVIIGFFYDDDERFISDARAVL